MGETVVLVPVPEAAAAVDRHRLRLTRAGADGMPPHVTLLYPFTEGERLDAAREDAVAALVAAVAPFDVVFATMSRFPLQPPILHLEPEPAAPFAALTAALVAAFPEHPPYGGVHDGLVPHLTVAIADAATLDAAEADVRRALPLHARVTEAALLERGGNGRWALRRRLPLAG